MISSSEWKSNWFLPSFVGVFSWEYKDSVGWYDDPVDPVFTTRCNTHDDASDPDFKLNLKDCKIFSSLHPELCEQSLHFMFPAGSQMFSHTHSDDRIMPRHDFRMKCVWTETCLAAERSHSSEQQTHTWTGSKQNRLCCSAASEQRNQSDSQRFSACIKGRRHTLIGCSHSLTHLSDRWSESAPISAERFWHVSDQTMK